MAINAFEELNPRGAIANIDTLLSLRFAAHKLALKPYGGKLQQGAGNHLSRSRGRGLEFEEVRAYQPGDDVRTIDWRVTARSTRTYTRLFREEQERPLLIVADQRPPMGFGSQRCFKSVMAAHLCALIGWAGLNGGDRVGGVIFGAQEVIERRPRRHSSAVLNLLQELCRFNQQLTNNISNTQQYPTLTEQLLSLRRLANSGTGIFIISDFHDWDSHCNDHLFHLARNCEITLCKVFDPLEKILPDNGIYTMTDGQQRLSIDSSEINLRNAFQNRFNAIEKQLQDTTKSLRMPLLEFSTTDNPLTILQQRYGARA
jgi:uncharacterized protein (DUF58 family)